MYLSLWILILVGILASFGLFTIGVLVWGQYTDWKEEQIYK